jgi:hypothetical protein
LQATSAFDRLHQLLPPPAWLSERTSASLRASRVQLSKRFELVRWEVGSQLPN